MAKKSADAAAVEHPAVVLLRGLADVVSAHSLSELVYDTPELTVTLRRGESTSPTIVQHHAVPAMAAPAPLAPAASQIAPAPAPELAAEEATEDETHHIVTSPFVGTFYRRPNPDADPYVDVGSRVEKGQPLCIVEAMKLMNEIEVDIAGTIVTILVDDAKPVEYGQPLFRISPA